MNAQVYYGLNLAWGLGNTAVTITGAEGIFQSMEHNLKLDENEVRDQRGGTVAWTGYNPVETLLVKYYVSDLGVAVSGSAPITLNTTVPDRGQKVSISTSDVTVSGSAWIMQDVLLNSANTEAVSATLKLIRYPQIS